MAPVYHWPAVFAGMRAAFCLAGLVMACSFLGFGAFLASLEFPLLAGLGTNVLIWALPGQVVFVDLWQRGADMLVIAIAVTLTAVRLLPMTTLVLAKSTVPGARRWPEFVAAHFTAVTLWVMANQYIDDVPRTHRLPWLIGLGAMLMIAMLGFTTAGYVLAGHLPVPVAATLVFFTPAFFLIALFGGCRWRFDYVAIGLGAGFGTLATLYLPQFDLLIGGLGGGTAAFLLARPRHAGTNR